MNRVRERRKARTRRMPTAKSARVECVLSFCYTTKHMKGAKAPLVDRLLVWKTGNLHVGRAFCAEDTMPLVSPRMRFPSGIPVASDETVRGTPF